MSKIDEQLFSAHEHALEKNTNFALNVAASYRSNTVSTAVLLAVIITLAVITLVP